MSASNEGQQGPQAGASSVCETEAPDGWPRYERLSSNGLLPRSVAVIDVQEIHRVLECSQLQRQSQYQQLCRHYASQIRYGCKNYNCQTPTCFSRNRRNSLRPYRTPSKLTAYALASYLASQDHPHRGLCPYPLQKPPAHSPQNVSDADIAQRYDAGRREFIVYPTTWRQVWQYRHTYNLPSSDSLSASATPYASRIQQSPIDAINQKRRMKKDPKSLGQNLYDSLSMLGFFLQQIPNAASVLALLCDPSDEILYAIPRCGILDNGTQPMAVKESLAGAVWPVSLNAESIAPFKGPPSTDAPNESHEGCLSIAHSPEQTSSNLACISHEIHKNHGHSAVFDNNLAAFPKPSASDCVIDTAISSTKNTNQNGFGLRCDIRSTMGKVKPRTSSVKSNELSGAVDRTASILPVYPILNCDRLDQLKEDVYVHRKYQSTEFNFVTDYNSDLLYRPPTSFVNRSLFFVLSDPDALLNSFHETNDAFKNSLLPHLDSSRLTHSFRDWNRKNGALIFDSLWIALEAIFTPPPEIDAQENWLGQSRQSEMRAGLSNPSSGHRPREATMNRYLSTLEVAHIVVICIHALTSLVFVGWPRAWEQVRQLRCWGIIVPSAPPNTYEYMHRNIEIIDGLEYEPAIRLTDRLLRAIGARMCYEKILIGRQKKEDVKNSTPETPFFQDSLVDTVLQHLGVVENVARKRKVKSGFDRTTDMDPGWTVTATFMEWLRTIIIKKWDSNPRIAKWGSVGVAVQLLDKLYSCRDLLNLQSVKFEMPFFHERIDTVEEPVRFLAWKPSTNQLHIYQYPSLFSTHHLVTYFRTINFTRILSQYSRTIRTQNIRRSLEMFLKRPHVLLISAYLKTTLLEHLVLEVSRNNVLEDTLNQLWGQKKRLLLKPLKVKLGDGEGGEVGLDHGGVTNEFFSILLSEAFKPDKGMFTVDPQTRMTWFQPGSLEAPWKFQMLGILFSLAVYNGVTLPVTFPLIFYQLLLDCDKSAAESIGETLGLDCIEDGWPSLAKALEELLSWSDGDVGETIMREYAFSFEFLGRKVDHNMKYPFHHPLIGPTIDDPGERVPEPDLVTNANRRQFVRDYIRFLIIETIKPQLEAFRKGWTTCLDPKSLQFFTASSLRSLVEGTQHISLPDLRRIVQYDDGYTISSPTIRAFWTVVEAYGQDDARRLLEFVTASARVPITGYESLTFKILRIGGAPASLPTSSTCFGNLYLPDYENVETLREKLGLAIRNSRGFGII